MKKLVFVLLVVFAFGIQNANAGVPMSDFLKKTGETLKNLSNKFQLVKKEYVEQLQGYMNEGTKLVKKGKKAADKVKDIAGKVKGGVEAATNAVNDPKGAATSVVSSVSGVINDMKLSDDLQDAFVAKSNLTPKEYKEKEEKNNEIANKRAADAFAMAYTTRLILIEEGKQEPEDFDAEDQDTVLQAINAKVSTIVVRLNYVQMLEAMTDELDYTQSLMGFNNSEEGDN